jgi:hypothetical protein
MNLGAQTSKTANYGVFEQFSKAGASDGTPLKYVQKKDKKMLTLAGCFEILRPHTENITQAI